MYNILKARINWVLLLFLLLLISPIVILFYFNNPSADDYCLSVLVQDKGLIGWQNFLYTTWFGRYFFTFAYSFNPLNFDSIIGYKIFAFLLFVLLLTSIFIFIRYAFRKRLTLEWQLISSLGIFVLFILGMPSIVEGVYWESGALTYQLGNIFGLLSLLMLIRVKDVSKKIHKIIFSILGSFFLIASIGSNETSMIMMLVISLVFLAVSLILKFKNKKIYLLFFLVSLISTLAVYKAPGNAVRLSQIVPVHAANDLVFSVSNSFSYSLQFISSSLNISLIPFLILFAYIGWSTLNLSLKKTILSLLVIPLSTFVLMWISCFPNYWIVGEQPVQRNLNITYFIFVFLLVSVVVLVVNLFKIVYRRYFKFKIPKPIYISFNIIFLILLSSLLFSVVFTNKTLDTAVTEIISGDAYLYNKQLAQRNDYFKSQAGKDVEVKTLSVYPKSIYFSDVSTSVNDYTNICTASYYNVKSILRIE